MSIEHTLRRACAATSLTRLLRVLHLTGAQASAERFKCGREKTEQPVGLVSGAAGPTRAAETAQSRHNNSIRLRPLPLLSLAIHYSLTIVPFYTGKTSVNGELTERMLHEEIPDSLNSVQNLLTKTPKTISLLRGVTSCSVVERCQCCGGIC